MCADVLPSVYGCNKAVAAFPPLAVQFAVFVSAVEKTTVTSAAPAVGEVPVVIDTVPEVALQTRPVSQAMVGVVPAPASAVKVTLSLPVTIGVVTPRVPPVTVSCGVVIDPIAFRVAAVTAGKLTVAAPVLPV